MAQLLGVDEIVPLTPWARVDAVLGWGRKPNADWAAAYARGRGVPFYRLEDGFLRSVGLGAEGDPPLSIVVDDLGIYYDATGPSRLEHLLASADPRLADPGLRARADEAITLIRKHGLSKYNRARFAPSLRDGSARNVLVVDQVEGDLSLVTGGATAATPATMLQAAARENPDARLWIKSHPDPRRSALAAHVGGFRLQEVPHGTNPIRLLEQMDHVYVMTSLLGFEALLCGVRVSVFACPFYAGWGLTDDRGPLPERRGRARTLEELFVAAYLLYARYLDADTTQRGSLEGVVRRLSSDVADLPSRHGSD